jgi:WD40 repeat protein
MPLPKKIFLISSLLLSAILLLWGVYYFSFKKPAQLAQKNQPEAKTASQEELALPSTDNLAASGKIIAISEEPVLSPVLSADDMIVKYYSAENGKTYQVGVDGKNKGTISSKELPSLSQITWSPDKTKVISKLSKNGTVKFYFYDYSTGKGVPLKDNIDSIAWESDDKIFYKYYNPSSRERSLNIANPDGSDWKKIMDLDLKDIRIARVPKTSLVSFWTVPDAYTKTVFRSASFVGTDYKTIFQEKFGADYKWNGDGTKVLVSHTDDFDKSKIRLAVINSQGGEYKNLEIPTLVTKCVWSVNNSVVYYALPGSIPDNISMPNDYFSRKFETADTFWKVDTATGKKSRIVELSEIKERLDAVNLFLNSDETMLFFVNRLDGKLYKIDLQ